MDPSNDLTLDTWVPSTNEQLYPPQEDDNPINPEMFDFSDISMPSKGIGVVDDWQTSSDVAKIESNEPRRISFVSSPSSTRPKPRRQKQKLSLERFLANKEECRSTCANSATNPVSRKDYTRLKPKLKLACSSNKLSYTFMNAVNIYW